jgi:hypothetical protein
MIFGAYGPSLSRSTIALGIRDTNPPEADQSESGASEPITALSAKRT